MLFEVHAGIYFFVFVSLLHFEFYRREMLGPNDVCNVDEAEFSEHKQKVGSAAPFRALP